MKTIIKIAIIVSIIISVGVISTLAYLIQSDFFLIPKRTSSDQWTNTVDCQGENQLIYNDECVYVIKDNDPEIEYTNKYFMKKDDKIVVYCEKPDIPSEHVVGPMIVEICIDIKSYWISDDNVIKYSADYTIDPILTDITISMSNGSIHSIEASKELPGIIINISANDKGRLIIDDPMSNLKKVFPDTPFEEFTVIIDGTEVKYDEISFNIIAVSFEENSKRVEIVPFLFL